MEDAKKDVGDSKKKVVKARKKKATALRRGRKLKIAQKWKGAKKLVVQDDKLISVPENVDQDLCKTCTNPYAFIHM